MAAPGITMYPEMRREEQLAGGPQGLLWPGP
jgi:hypothetical protein